MTEDVTPIDTKKRVEKALSGLEEIAEKWAIDVDLPSWSKEITGKTDAIEALMQQSFIEGAYFARMDFLNSKKDN